MPTRFDPCLTTHLLTPQHLMPFVFDVVEAAVAHWPEARQRLRRARRHLDGHPGHADDLWFAANLVARTLDADHGLGARELVALFDVIGLPVDAVPLYPRRSRPLSMTGRALVAALAAPELAEFDELDDELAP